jgi:hypothetical protein
LEFGAEKIQIYLDSACFALENPFLCS